MITGQDSFRDKERLYKEREEHWLKSVNMFFAPLVITLNSMVSELDHQIDFALKIKGNKEHAFKNITMTFDQFVLEDHAIDRILGEMENAIKAFLIRYACDNF